MSDRRLATTLGCGLGLAIWGLLAAAWSPLAPVERAAYDHRFGIQGPLDRPEPGIVIVDMDDASLDQLGEYPWPRRTHARLIRKLAGWGARAIGFDVVFLGPSPSGADDLALGHAIAEAGNVVLGGLERDVQVAKGQGLEKISYQAPFFEAAHGAVAYDLDPADGAVRSGRLSGRSRVESFDMAVLRRVDRALPTRANARIPGYDYRIRFAGPPGTYPTVSYARVLDGILDPRIDPEFNPEMPGVARSYAEFFRGKIVLVGTSAPLLHDVFHTPFARGETFMPGVEIHANSIDTLRRGDAPRPAPWWAGLLVTILWAGGATLVFGRLRPAAGAGGGLAVVGLYAALNAGLFLRGVDLPVVAPVAAAGVAFPVVYGRRYVQAERDKSRIRATFSRYVAPKVVDEMLRHPDLLPSLRNERRNVTVLFTDIEGFTSFAESHDPDTVAQRLNEALTALTQVVFDHGGTLDKYIGDAIMAVWGNIGPVDSRADAQSAVRCAVEMQRVMARLRASRDPGEGTGALRIRIGVHSGEALVGNFGSPLKLDFTAIGDTVNTASRLEGLNKHFGTAIIVSGATAAFLADTVELRPLGESILKGKSTGVLAYEVIPSPDLPGAPPAPSSPLESDRGVAR